MRFVDEFRDPEMARVLAREIARLADPRRHYKFMEVCGGHTHTIYKHGIEDYLPPNLTLVHGPGCPVCVIPMGRVDDAVHIAEQPEVILTSFGDMMRVPGGRGSFLDATARGADIRMVYSPLDALKVARQNTDKQVVFMAIGFETTAPSTALTVLQAAQEGMRNFSDILQAIYMLLRQLAEGRCEVENQYTRVVPWDGNRKALQVIHEVMELRPYFEWRGLGFISHSALKVRDTFTDFDAERRFAVPGVRVTDPKACQCGEVLKGVLKPWECKVFGTACTPETPIGTCMVSSEGACAAYYNYGRFTRTRVREVVETA